MWKNGLRFCCNFLRYWWNRQLYWKNNIGPPSYVDVCSKYFIIQQNLFLDCFKKLNQSCPFIQDRNTLCQVSIYQQSFNIYKNDIMSDYSFLRGRVQSYQWKRMKLSYFDWHFFSWFLHTFFLPIPNFLQSKVRDLCNITTTYTK